MKWLGKINSPDDLKKIPRSELPKVAEEIRGYILEVVSKNGGHLGAALGAVGWGLGEMEQELAVDSFVDLAVVLEVNTWQDKSSVQLLIEDIKPSEG